MIDFFSNLLIGKKVLILGFGKEGISTYKLIRSFFSEMQLFIADRDENLLLNHGFLFDDDKVSTIIGPDYLNSIDEFEIIIKSPGISLKKIKDKIESLNITSQTDIFFRLFSQQIIGITGTKGKSTTASLLYHTLSKIHSSNVVLVGNIGLPPFDVIHNITSETLIVFEVSSHQLEFITVSPHISILLNLFQEHLDHYNSFEEYQLSKLNLLKYQTANDYFITNADDKLIMKWINSWSQQRKFQFFSFDEHNFDGCYLSGNSIIINQKENCKTYPIPSLKLIGHHNLANIMAVLNVVMILGHQPELILKNISSFKGLPHRLEYVGEYYGIHFYNDSIATIPEATIQAVKSLNNVGTLIIGGYDRGIEYSSLVDFLKNENIPVLILSGAVGKRIHAELKLLNKILSNIFLVENFDQVISLAFKHTPKGHICLLSPAASSYDMFRNFEHRGDMYKKMIREYVSNQESLSQEKTNR